jgi:hypothetical protein
MYIEMLITMMAVWGLGARFHDKVLYVCVLVHNIRLVLHVGVMVMDVSTEQRSDATG